MPGAQHYNQRTQSGDSQGSEYSSPALKLADFAMNNQETSTYAYLNDSTGNMSDYINTSLHTNYYTDCTDYSDYSDHSDYSDYTHYSDYSDHSDYTDHTGYTDSTDFPELTSILEKYPSWSTNS